MDIIHFQFCLPTSKKICLLDCLPVGNDYSARDNIYQLVVIDQNLKKHDSSKSNTNLKVSMRATNIEDKSIKYNQATMHPFSASNLGNHLKVHSGEKSIKCNQCDFASSRAGNLRRHLKTLPGEKSNKCDQCDYDSSQASNLRRHLKTHSG